jgi:hypothetical protein
MTTVQRQTWEAILSDCVWPSASITKVVAANHPPNALEEIDIS